MDPCQWWCVQPFCRFLQQLLTDSPKSLSVATQGQFPAEPTVSESQGDSVEADADQLSSSTLSHTERENPRHIRQLEFHFWIFLQPADDVPLELFFFY